MILYKLVNFFQWFLYFFWLIFIFHICCSILTTSNIFFVSRILIGIVKWWLKDIRRVCRLPICYQWYREKDIPQLSIAFFDLVTNKFYLLSGGLNLLGCILKANFLNLFVIYEWFYFSNRQQLLFHSLFLELLQIYLCQQRIFGF